MARDYDARLRNLKSRRVGLDAATAMFSESVEDRLRKSEAYEGRDKRSAVKYTLGAMQEVDPEYTRIGREEAARVGAALQRGLATESISVAFELQGSVPLNVHIRGASDVDLLSLHQGFFTADWSGPRASGYIQLPGNVFDDMRQLRAKSERILQGAYPQATVDVTGAKAIKLEGGSLKRKIDVVPSHWHNTAAYQQTQQQADRGVKVWDKRAEVTVGNMPFLHIKRIVDQCNLTNGGLRKSIRLVKNIKKDAEVEGKKIDMPSYDIAATMWHCDWRLLAQPINRELAILAAAQAHFEHLVNNPEYAKALSTPDNTRKIFDTPDKLTALAQLAAEVAEVADDVALELLSAANNIFAPPTNTLRKALQDAWLAA